MAETVLSSERLEKALDSLKTRIEVLVSNYEQVSAHNRELSEELDRCRHELDTNKLRINELEKQIENLQLIGAFSVSSRDNREAKQKIGKLIKEIDNCIDMLND